MASWLPIGLWVGDFDYVLTTVSRNTFERQLYQWLLYSGMIAVAIDSWRRHRPSRPRWGAMKFFGLYFLQGLVASTLLRLVLIEAGWANWSLTDSSLIFLSQVLVGCFAVALVEEAIFRGFLLGHFVASLGWRKGAFLTSILFASVHLFRPGGMEFKLPYGLGLLALGYLLAFIAWRHDALWASAGFHAGVILLNLGLTLRDFRPGFWSGWNDEPVSGAVSVGMTLAFFAIWERATRRKDGTSTDV